MSSPSRADLEGERVPEHGLTPDKGRFDLVVIGDDLAAAFASWNAVRSGFSCCWVTTSAEPEIGAGRSRIVTPVLPLLARHRQLPILPRTVAMRRVRWRALCTQVGTLLRSHIAQRRADREEISNVLAALVRRSCNLFNEDKAAFSTLVLPTTLTVLENGKALSGELVKQAEQFGVVLDVQLQQKAGQGEGHMAWNASATHVVPDPLLLFKGVRDEFVKLGGRCDMVPGCAVFRDSEVWRVKAEQSEIRAARVLITSEEVFRRNFPRPAKRIAMGKFLVVRQHFARLSERSGNYIAADASFSMVEAVRGQRVALAPLPVLAPGEAQKRLSDVLSDAVVQLIGEPRDVNSVDVLRAAHDLVPIVDEIAGIPDLWVAFGFGDNDVSLGPAVFQLAVARMRGFRLERFERVLGVERLAAYSPLSVAQATFARAGAGLKPLGRKIRDRFLIHRRKADLKKNDVTS